MPKKQVFELRMASQSNESGLLIGKFPEPVVSSLLDSSDSQDINMYVKEEEMQEDDVLEVTSTNQHEILEAKGIDMKSKKRRKKYKKKSEIVLEQGAPSAASHGVSKAINWVGNRVDTAVEATSQPTQASVGKYAILQIMTSDSGGRVDKHVNVLHVGDWFSFSRPSSARTVVTLDDVNTEFEKQQRSQQESNKRYNKLVSAYRNSSRRGGEEEGEEDAADEVPLAFGKTSVSVRGGGKKPLDIGMDADNTGGETNNWQDVDMAAGVSDDEDDTGIVQAFDSEQAKRVADEIEAYNDSSEGESDDEKDKSDDEAAAEKQEQLDQDQAGLKHLEGGAAQLESAMEFKHKVLATIKEKDLGAGGGNKRKLERIEKGPDASVAGGSCGGDSKLRKTKHVSISSDASTEGGGNAKKKTKISSSLSSGSGSAALSEEGVRAYIQRQGGRVQTKVLLKEFKKKIKEAGATAKADFTKIVSKLTKKEEDSVQGTMLVLKQQ